MRTTSYKGKRHGLGGVCESIHHRHVGDDTGMKQNLGRVEAELSSPFVCVLHCLSVQHFSAF
ncbi:hypothetical protein Csa_022180 [Cucumis sativus]|uniref:Uncharacterized protein n=1 Tax=Cucumis sativus TaxID=3659 RepID=A0A0A0LQD9_CUCSA|nr:hypothetical protein Csa_022180 [Cucumis sativus]